MKTLEDYLKTVPYRKEEVDIFLDESQDNWAYYDSEVGYLLKTSYKKDGMDDSFTIASYEEEGFRRIHNYKNKECRINTYGDSFTQCHQVSDGETWQEYLGAHFGEPIRNFGIGGHGVYQAFTRMKRQELDEKTQAEYVILNIFSDDHFRNIDAWRWVRIEPFREEIRQVDPNYFHANPWRYLRISEETGDFAMCESLAPTKEALYKLCNQEHVFDLLKDDLIVHLELAKAKGEFDQALLASAAKQIGVSCDFSDAEKASETAYKIHQTYALKSTLYILDLVEAFLKERGKKLMVLLTYGANEVEAYLENAYRFDQMFIDALKEKDYPFVDALTLHKKDYAAYAISPGAYRERYFVNGFGHYNPAGNHFFAFAIKDALLKWLDMPPITYTNQKQLSSAANAASHLA